MQQVKKAAVFAGVLLLVIALGGVLWTWNKSKVQTRQDSVETILNGVRSSQSSLVMLNFWASWCEPCKVELPALKELKSHYDKDLKIILVSIDDPSDINTAENFLRDNQIDFQTYYKGSQSLKIVSQIFPQWSGAVPATVIMNPALKILDAWEGDTSLEEFKQRVQKQLRGS